MQMQIVWNGTRQYGFCPYLRVPYDVPRPAPRVVEAPVRPLRDRILQMLDYEHCTMRALATVLQADIAQVNDALYRLRQAGAVVVVGSRPHPLFRNREESLYGRVAATR